MFNIEIPYPIGTYLKKIENGQEHLDKVVKYIITEQGLFVILQLDVNKDPRLSREISVNDLLNNWVIDLGIHFTTSIGSLVNTNLDFSNCDVILSRERKKL